MGLTVAVMAHYLLATLLPYRLEPKNHGPLSCRYHYEQAFAIADLADKLKPNL